MPWEKTEKITLEVARMLKDDFLQQNGMSEYDRYCPFYKTSAMLRNFVTFHDLATKAVTQGDVTFAHIKDSTSDIMFTLSQMKFEVRLQRQADIDALISFLSPEPFTRQGSGEREAGKSVHRHPREIPPTS